MKKIILAIAAMVLAAGIASAQDMAQATELYNNGATAISQKNWTEALDCFQKALTSGQPRLSPWREGGGVERTLMSTLPTPVSPCFPRGPGVVTLCG